MKSGPGKDNHPPEGFSSARSLAEEFARDKSKTGHLLDDAISKAERNRTVLDNIWEDLQALFRLIRAWRKGAYAQTPWQTIIFAIAGIIYFVNPFDIVPDFLPGAGYLDDATVVGFVLKSIKHDIAHFLSWETMQKDEEDSANQLGD
ncbi:MAG: YkvA family protein [bacterium]